jgi:WD40 repeat protein
MVKVRDVGAGREIGSWKIKFPNGLVQLQLNRDGTRLAALLPVGAAQSRRVVVWDVANGKELFARELPAVQFNFAAAREVALSPDGKLLATGERVKEGQPIKIWQVADPACEPTTLESSEGAGYLVFSPDSTRLAAVLAGGGPAGATILRIWETTTGKPRADAPAKDARDIAFSADGTRLVGAPLPTDGRKSTSGIAHRAMISSCCTRRQRPDPGRPHSPGQAS